MTAAYKAHRLEIRRVIGFASVGLDEPYRVYISEDPICLEGGDVNFYAYVQNNPLTLIDPFGLQAHYCNNDPFNPICIPIEPPKQISEEEECKKESRKKICTSLVECFIWWAITHEPNRFFGPPELPGPDIIPGDPNGTLNLPTAR